MKPINYMGYIAKQHTKEMEEKYKDEIINSIKNTKEYKDISPVPEVNNSRKENTKIRILDLDSVTALFSTVLSSQESISPNVAILNFASYKHPGGMFIEGSRAQEEALCHESTLYNILKEFDDSFYRINRDNKNHALYHSNLLYVPDVVFERNEGKVIADVITCAAPNKGVACRYKMVSEEEYMESLRHRIDSLLYSAYDNNIDYLILGAFGCGVFKNNPEDVANVFKSFLDIKYHNVFKEVIFPIPRDKKGVNLQVFRKVFEESHEF